MVYRQSTFVLFVFFVPSWFKRQTTPWHLLSPIPARTHLLEQLYNVFVPVLLGDAQSRSAMVVHYIHVRAVGDEYPHDFGVSILSSLDQRWATVIRSAVRTRVPPQELLYLHSIPVPSGDGKRFLDELVMVPI
jgi:hypothetical protein